MSETKTERIVRLRLCHDNLLSISKDNPENIPLRIIVHLLKKSRFGELTIDHHPIKKPIPPR